jgi:hypothetical protein
MADNAVLGIQLSGLAVGSVIAADRATYSGDADALVQLLRLVHVEGAEGAKTVTELIRLINSIAGATNPGLPFLAVRRDVASTPADADGKYTTLAVDAAGRLYVVGSLTLGSALPAGNNNIGDVDVLTLPPIPAGTNTIGTVNIGNAVGVGGLTAHDAALIDNPLTMGGYAASTAPVEVSADGDAVRAWLLRNGAQVIAEMPSTVLYDGSLTAPTVAAALGTAQAWREVLIVNDPSSTEDAFVGNATSQSVRLVPGQGETLRVANRNLVYVRSAGGTATVTYHGRN